MRPKTATSSLLLALTLSLAACGGSAAADTDPTELLQNNQFAEAITAIEGRLEGVTKGSEDHKDLVINYAHALAAEGKATASKTAFLEFAGANADLLEPGDYRYVVEQLRTYEHYVDAVAVMHEGKERWPEDTTMVAVLDALKADILSSDSKEGQSALDGLGYL